MKNIVLFCFLLSVISTNCTESSVEKITIVGIKNLDTDLLITEIRNICALNPKVLAVDVQFSELENNKLDTLLRAALESCHNVVLPSQLKNYHYEDLDYTDTLGSHPYFVSGNIRTGFVNVILEDDKYATLKKFSTREIMNGKVEYHFAVQAAMLYDSVKTVDFINRSPKIVEINYQTDQSIFKKIRASYALTNSIERSDIEGKIVLLGSFWPMEGYSNDAFRSPLNPTPEDGADMWGVMYLANVVAQILE
jgi:CHASE2 domain-containing sensor protein